MFRSKLAPLIAVLTIGIGPTSDTSVLIPMMGEIARSLPHVNSYLVSLVMTISSLSCIPTSLLVGALVNNGVITKRMTIITGLLIISIGGAAGALCSDIYYLLALRALVGVGSGCIAAMVAPIAADYFDGRQRATVMGWYNASSSLISIGLSLLAGYLCAIQWRLGFLTYLLCAVILIYQWVVLRANGSRAVGLSERRRPKPTAAERPKGMLGSPVWVLIGITFFSQFFGNVTALFLAIFLDQEKIGDSASAGIAYACFTVAAIAVSVGFAAVYEFMKRYTIAPLFCVMGISLLLLAISHTFMSVLVAYAVFGLGYGATIPYIYNEVTVAPPASSIPMTSGLVNATIFGGFFLSAFLQPTVVLLFHQTSLRFLFEVTGIACIVCGGLTVILVALSTKASSLIRAC